MPVRIAPILNCDDNCPMPVSPWQRRIQRAQELASQHSFAAEILGFYTHVARFQEDLHQRLSTVLQSPAASAGRDLTASELSELSSRFGSFLSMAEARGPKALAELSRELHARGVDFWRELLNRGWTAHSASDAEGLLAQAFLQPYAELLRSRASASPQSDHARPVSVLLPQTRTRRIATDGRWRRPLPDLFFLSGRVGIPPHRLPGMRRGGRQKACRLHRQRLRLHSRGMLRRLQDLYQRAST